MHALFDVKFEYCVNLACNKNNVKNIAKFEMSIGIISHIIRNMILVSKLTMKQEILNTTKYNF